MSHYDQLGVEPTADPTVVRRAYLALARRHHPDSGAGGDADRMARINDAWSVLGDPEKRARYDILLDSSDHGDTPADVRRRVVRERPEPEPWRPYDDFEPEPMPPEDLARPSLATRARTLVPAFLFVAGVGDLLIGLVTRFAPLLVFGLILLVASAISFVLAPVLTMFESIRNER